jgi:hypothetical protein
MLNAGCLVTVKILPIPGQKLELWNRTTYLQLSRYSDYVLGSNWVFNVVDYPSTLAILSHLGSLKTAIVLSSLASRLRVFSLLSYKLTSLKKVICCL